MSIECIQDAKLEDTGFNYTMSLIQGKYKMFILYALVLFCTLYDAPLVRLNDSVSAWIERIYANYLRLFVQFI